MCFLDGYMLFVDFACHVPKILIFFESAVAVVHRNVAVTHFTVTKVRDSKAGVYPISLLSFHMFS